MPPSVTFGNVWECLGLVMIEVGVEHASIKGAGTKDTEIPNIFISYCSGNEIPQT